MIRIRRRELLAGFALGATTPARGAEAEAAVQVLLAALPEALRPPPIHHAIAEPWGPDPDRHRITAIAAEDERLAVGLVRLVQDGPPLLVAGPASVEALTLGPFQRPVLWIERRHPLASRPVVALGVRDSLANGLHGYASEALHLFLLDGTRLRPILACMLAASRSVADDRPPPGTVRRWSRQFELLAEGRADGAVPPPLLVREPRSGRIVSRHRWRGEGYHPHAFLPRGPVLRL